MPTYPYTIQIPLPPPDAIRLGGTCTFKVDVHGTVLHDLLTQVIGTCTPPTGAVGGTTSRNVTFAEVVESVTLFVNNKEVSKWDPLLTRKLESFVGTYDPSSDLSCFTIMLARAGLPFASWGSGDITSLSFTLKLRTLASCLKTDGTYADATAAAITEICGGLQATMVGPNAPAQGTVFLQTFQTLTPIDGLNIVADLPMGEITRITRLVFDESRITNVRLLIGSTEVYNFRPAWQLEAMRKNPAYQVPAVVNCFPVMLDCIGRVSEFPSLIESGVRRPLRVEFTLVKGSPDLVPFKVLVEGLREEGNANTPKA